MKLSYSAIKIPGHSNHLVATVFMLGVLLALSFQCAFGSDKLGHTEILWDTWGIPHIFAEDTEGLFYAFGWAQMQSHGDLILRLYGQSRGRAAEYWGEKYLQSDRWVVTMGIPQRASEWCAAQSPGFRHYLDAFAAGINDYAREHGDQIDDAVEAVLPVNATDIVAHSQRAIHFTFVASQRVARTGQRWLESKGSNAWAIAPSRSVSGNAMLLANPHLPWSGIYLFYEAQLVSPEVDAYGVALVGFPVLGIAFNDYLGWSHTVNTHDGQDAYELALVEGGYRWDDGVRAFGKIEHALKVKQDDGTLRPEKLSVKHSIHGPVIAEKGEKAIALSVAGIDQPGLMKQWWDMARARNLDEFENVLKSIQIPMFTVIYADRDGHIMHLFNGMVPIRPKGNWNWGGVVPGDTPKTLWTGFHPYEDLPRIIDPPGGWLQNANDPPWTTTVPFVIYPDDYPPYMAPRPSMHFRAQRSARMLNDDAHISFEEIIKYKFSTRMEMADRLLDDLLPAARSSGSDLAHRAADVLEAWDRNADADSRGALLFQVFFRELRRSRRNAKLFAVPWSEHSPLSTPDGLPDPAAAVAALEAAASRVEETYGALDVAWGEVCRLRCDSVDLPGNGGPGSLGIFRVVSFSSAGENRFKATSGDSYVAAIEFSNPIRAMALMSYGNSSQPGSPHRTDQLKLFARKELRPIWRTRADIEDHLDSREAFTADQD